MLLQGGVDNRVCGALKKQMDEHPPDLILLFPYWGKRGFKTHSWFGKAQVHRVNLNDWGPDSLWKEDQLNTWFEAWKLGKQALEDGKTVACVCVKGKNRSLTMAHALRPTAENMPWHEPMLALAKCKNREEILALAPVDANTKTAGRKRVRDSSAEEEEEGEEEEETPSAPKKPRKDLLAVFGSHEMVLTHHMQLPAGFTMETDEENKIQIVMPKRTKSNEIKSFRARLGRHLRAVGFVCLEDDDEKPEEEAQFAHLDLGEKYMDAWVRPTVNAEGKNVALDKYTLKPPVDPAVREHLETVDPFDLV